MKKFTESIASMFRKKKETEEYCLNAKAENTIPQSSISGAVVCGVSSDMIDSLEENEIFVFGSNLAGMHGGGAARIAWQKFGAVLGQGVGLQGQSYAIPTMHGGVEDIKPYVDQFIDFAKENPQLNFMVTRIGCGIAGFQDHEIAPLFKDCLFLPNVFLPRRFIEILCN